MNPFDVAVDWIRRQPVWFQWVIGTVLVLVFGLGLAISDPASWKP